MGLCPNICPELARDAKSVLEKDVEKHRAGLEMKQQYIFDAENELKEKRTQLEQKKIELEELKQKKTEAEGKGSKREELGV